MTTTEQPLPDEIQSALQAHESAKADYLNMRERLVSLARRIEKHRKTADAALAEASSAGGIWRSQFRKTDGELTKEIRDHKRKEVDARELAEEYRNLAGELRPQFEICQLDTYQVRESYLLARQSACSSYNSHCLVDSAIALFAHQEASIFFSALVRNGLISAPCLGERQSAYDNEQLLRLGKTMAALIHQAGVSEPTPESSDPVWNALSPIHSLAEEDLPEPLASSPMSRFRRHKELTALLEEDQSRLEV
ncbi:hypothetical protein ACSLV1_07720 [Pseudomonas aeruginosa]|uniref:hypothetical protein n=1 Tax=Pseudomonas aeruginosa TaxID=287 RepID=UPI00071B7D04|nr:hypothetical protein [Pseudomonas aeruginosa]KSI07721.1 hypothetical protein AO984_20460 [Pseudomonas aeruginosa]MBN0026306.1 hypothetical protein [Pseudomonas aeruginosa]MBN0055616.1 hypothetical protein [Pseudomonas aeruginosa]MBN0065439.1 hypothetical protein [Pseudomonas aeruginosa]MBN0105322.1 hypothetical protein [Pseudomonas aeruginosa]